MDPRFRRIGSKLLPSARSADWLADNRLIFLHGKEIGRIMTGRMFGTWGETIYLQIVDEPDLLLREGTFAQLEPGVYIEIEEPDKIAPPTVKMRAGIYEMIAFLRVLAMKRFRGDNSDPWNMRSTWIRKIRENAECFDTGVYELRARSWPRQYSNDLPARISNEDSQSEIVANPNSGTIVRTPDFAGGGISSTEKLDISELIKKWGRHVFRTQPIDPVKIEESIKALYQAFGLAAPQVVIMPEPLSTRIAGIFAAVFREVARKGSFDIEKLSGVRLDRGPFDRCVTYSIISKAFSDATFGTARSASRASTDEATDREIHALINADTVTRGFLQHIRNFTDPSVVFTDLDSTIDCYRVVEGINAVCGSITDEIEIKNHDVSIMELTCMLSKGDTNLRDLLMSCNDIDAMESSNVALSASACKDVLGLKLPVFEKYSRWEDVAYQCAAFVMHKEFCFVSDFPEVIHLDEQSRLHCSDGPSLKWRNGRCVYNWHGTYVPAFVIETPENITVEIINNTGNQELRRVMIERYGAARFLKDSNAEEVHRDEFGTLYRQVFENDEPLVMVKVINSTAEPDGSFREYFLRVPPQITTAKEAVAWSFNLSSTEYKPTKQT